MPERALTDRQPISVRRYGLQGLGFPSLGRTGWLLLSLGLVLLAAAMLDPVASALREWGGRWFSILVVAMLTSACLVPASAMLAVRIGALDIPDRRKVHDRPTPRLGGLAVFAGTHASDETGSVFSSDHLVSIHLEGTRLHVAASTRSTISLPLGKRPADIRQDGSDLPFSDWTWRDGVLTIEFAGFGTLTLE